MDTRQKIAVIEAALKRENVSVNALCREAEVDRSCWTRWKTGKTAPNMTTWDKVVSRLPPSVRDALNETRAA